MHNPIRCLPIAALLLVGACAGNDAASSPTALAKSANGNGPAVVTVYQQNLYIGGDVDAVIMALASPDPNDDLPALFDAVATLERTDFPARAAAIAGEVARTHPHIIGLQEVSTLDIVIPPAGIDYHMDFLAVLQQALQAKGLNYVVAAQELNITATPAPGISLVDRDVMLVESGSVQVITGAGHRFTYNLGEVAPGVDLERGWVQATLVIGGRTFEVASLHTEGTGSEADLEQLHAAQILDVAVSMGDASPAIVLGDFNAQPTSQAYQVMLAYAFQDVWANTHPGAKGYTFGHYADLSDMPAQLTERIDYIWTRGLGVAKGPGSTQGQITRWGDVPADRVKNSAGQYIWPSDHAGVVADIMR